MNFEFLKQLKDAGFPLRPYPKRAADMDGPLAPEHCSPTLSELIKGCGEKFGGLMRGADTPPNKWTAYHDAAYALHDPNIKDDDEIPNAEGVTPEEAVARLWLVLQERGGIPTIDDVVHDRFHSLNRDYECGDASA